MAFERVHGALWGPVDAAWADGRPRRRLPPTRDRLRGDGAAGATDDETPGGCGWYVSSLDLAQGLELTEVEWIDADLPPHLAAALRFV